MHARTKSLTLFAGAALAQSALAGLVGPGGAHIWTGAVSTNWNVGANWTTGVVPGSGDDAIINGSITNIFLSADSANLASLFFANANDLATNGRRLRVTSGVGETTINGANSNLVVTDAPGSAPAFETDELAIENQGRLTVLGGDVAAQSISITGGGRIFGHGVITIDAAGPVALGAVSGERITASGGNLTISALGGGSIALPPLLQVNEDSTLDILGPLLVDPTDAELMRESALHLSASWTLDGMLTVDAGDGSANLSGGAISVEGAIEVDSGELVIGPAVSFAAGSIMDIAQGARVSIEAGAHTAWPGASAVVARNGALRINGVQQLGTTWAGDIFLSGGALETYGAQFLGWRMSGELEMGSSAGTRSRIAGDAALRISGDAVVSGLGVEIENSVQLLSTSSMHLMHAASEVIVEGSLLQSNGADITGAGSVSIVGSMRTVEPSTLDVDLINAGEYEIDGVVQDAAYTYIGGSYTQTPGGRLRVQIGGLAPDERDILETAGGAMIAGELHVELIDGFEPEIGDMFVVLTANGGLAGEFETVAGEPGFAVSYTPFSAFLTYVGAPSCPGDVNGDGAVDFSDLNALLIQFGSAGPGLSADINGDELVDFSDLNALLILFGTSCD